MKSRDALKRSRGSAVFLSACAVFHVWLAWPAINRLSPTFDEPLHFAAGLAYWKTGEFRLNGLHHPPLSSLWASIPAAVAGFPLPLDHPAWTRADWRRPWDQYAFADWTLFRQDGAPSGQKALESGRVMMLIASTLSLLALYAAGRWAFGENAGRLAAFIGACDPAWIAHGTLVTTDFLFALFFFCSFAALDAWNRRGGGQWAAATGLAIGAAFAAKFSAVLIPPAAAAWWFFSGKTKMRWREPFVMLLSAAAVVASAYGVIHSGVFWEGLTGTLTRLQGGRASVLFDQWSAEGWWYYFPAAFLLKTPLAMLLGVVSAAFLVFRKRLSVPSWLVIPPAIYFLAACASSVQIGHRHILPVYPFVYVIAAAAGAAFLKQRKTGVIAVSCAALWLAGASVWARPHFLSYFNEIAGGGSRGHRYLTDSNVDWGQGLIALKALLDEKGVDAIYLSYFGSVDPAVYGIRYVSVAPYGVVAFRDTAPDMSKASPQWLVVSATNFRGTYHIDRALFGWLTQKTPVAVVADSLLVFDVTGDRESHERLRALLAMMDNGPAVRIQDRILETPAAGTLPGTEKIQ